LTQKQKIAIADYQTVARYFIEQGYTKPRSMIADGHLDGLTMSASVNQARELFRCALMLAVMMDTAYKLSSRIKREEKQGNKPNITEKT
jgi:prolyl oligopeptidase PreP (S9A serine peptidase family)